MMMHGYTDARSWQRPSSSSVPSTPGVKKLNTELLSRTVSYHGLPLQKIWEGERGEQDLAHNGIIHPDYSIYQSRQKYLTFQDRAKRLKLHQFISKKADLLFEDRLVEANPSKLAMKGNEREDVVQMPPYEVFYNIETADRTRHFFETVQPGDVVYGTVNGSSPKGLIIKLICVNGSIQRFVGDLGIKAIISMMHTVPVFNKKIDRYDNNDYVCCEVIEVSRESQKLILSMKGEFKRTDDGPPFGLITTENFPDVYKTAVESKNRPYTEVLESISAFNNPRSEEVLFEEVGLKSDFYYTNMASLRGKFPHEEYASEIRQNQASKWAFRSVAEGIEHFKEGRHSEAFQCLNKALSIDPRNVEGLVARGALYANSGSFRKAVEDFENALKLNANHANARKYLGETLVALGRSYEEENNTEEAKKAYYDCLKVVPNHEEALNSLETLRVKSFGKQIVEPAELELPPLNLNKVMIDTHKSDLHKEKKKKEKSKKKRKKHDSSSSSSSSGSSSDSSSSDSSSSNSSSSGSNSRRKKKHKEKRNEISPFSQQMSKGAFQFNQPFGGLPSGSGEDYESKVRHFLEMAREDDDHEDKVRKLLLEAAKYQEERKTDEKSKKRKRKEEKKAKKEAKKKRKKEKHSKKSKKDKLELNDIENQKIREALKIFENLPVLDDLGAKLSEIYGTKKKDEPSSSTSQPSASNQFQRQGAPSKSPLPPSKRSFDSSTNEQNKWKMSFSKEDARATIPGPSKAAGASTSKRQSEFNAHDSDEDSHYPVRAPQQPKERRIPSPLKQYGRTTLTRSPPPPAPPVKSGPVVLDKFGNFRLAIAEQPITKPVEPEKGLSRFGNSRSRSRERHRRSRSSSRSSYERRRFSRSRSGSREFRRRLAISRSRSRSRSRSVSPRPRNFREGGRGRRMRGSYLDRFRYPRGGGKRRGSPISPIRGENPLGRPFGGGRGYTRGRGRGGGIPVGNRLNSPFRKNNMKRSPVRRRSRSRDRYRARSRSKDDRQKSSDRRFDEKNGDKSSRSREKKESKEDKAAKEVKEGKDRKSIEATPDKDTSKDKATPSNRIQTDDPPPPGTEEELDSIELMIQQANKDRKKEMLQRNPDLVKKIQII